MPEHERMTNTVAPFLCEFCYLPLDPTATTTMHGVRGWEKPRKGGGTNMIHLRRTTGRYAHERCVDERKGVRR